MTKAPRTTRRRVALAVSLLVAAVLVLWWRWPAPEWTLSIEASDTDVMPWRSVAIVAKIAPAGAPRQPVRWAWTSDGAPIAAADGPEVQWRSGIEGAHLVEVTATAANGVAHRAQVAISVRGQPFIGFGGATVTPAPPPDRDAGASLPFEIADIWVEKSEVCQGEPTRIRLTAFDRRGDEKWLRPNIGGEQSWEVAYLPALVTPGLHQVHVSLVDDLLGRGMVESDVYVEVKDCVAPFPVFVEHRSIPPDEEHVAFAVVVFEGPQWQQWAHRSGDDRGHVPRARPAAFQWDFGDGTSRTSVEPRINHRYPAQADRGNERATTYKAKVDALDETGRRMGTAYAPVTLVNTMRNLRRDNRTLQLVTGVPPGPATIEEDGSRAVRVTLRNIDPSESAHLSELRVKLVGCDGKDATERQLAVSSVFEADSIPAGATISGRFSVSSADVDGNCSASVQIFGTSSPGNLRVTGFFALDPGSRRGQTLSLEQSRAMQRARALLGDPSVIPLDAIQRLEDEGKIPRASLTPDPF